ncbi:hypothetical protein C0992_008689 [Termitomyces sp. T32_za158]|nr:hypothetical protein C0992_008689 [Termitomyces sp. T32_za158]
MHFTTAFISLLAAVTTAVNGERHVVHFDNRCGFGTPMLIQGPNVLSTGNDFTSSGPLISAIA